MKKKKIFVTGSTGFLGTELCKKLLSLGAKITGFGRREPNKELTKNKNFTFIQDDLSNISKYKDQILESDIIFHLAANPSINYANKFPVEDFKINALGTLEIINIIKDTNIRFVYTSTIAVYQDKKDSKLEENEANPESFYGLSKFTAEKYLEQYHKNFGLNYLTLRFGYIYGKGCDRGPIFDIVKPTIKNEKIVLFAHSESKLDFVYIDDAIEALIMAGLNEKVKAHSINISEGKGIKISGVIQVAKLVFKKKEITYEVSPNANMQIKELVLDTSKSRKVLKWKAKTSLKNGILKMVGKTK